MQNRRLPVCVTIDGHKYPINRKGDYEVILDVIAVLEDKELTERERPYVALNIFYDFNIPDDVQKAWDEMLRFINCGETEKPGAQPPKPLMNWNKDYPVLVAPINRIVGYDIRSVEYVHWWTFVAAYMEIGECTFQTIVGIRNKKQKGKKLDDWEREFYRANRGKIDLGVEFSGEEEQFFTDLLGVKFE